MEYLQKHKKLVMAAAFFAAFMLLCTLISKSVYASTLPVIKTAQAQQREIGHRVEAEGMVEQSREYAVSALSGLKVRTVYVSAGSEIAGDTVLFDIDLEELNRQIREIELEIKKLELEAGVLKRNAALEEQEQLLAKERARQDYQIAGVQADQDLKTADAGEKEAARQLKEHENSRPQTTSQEERSKRLEEFARWERELAGAKAACEAFSEELEENKREIARLEEQLGGGPGVSDGDRLSRELAQARARGEALQGELASQEETVRTMEESAPSRPDFSQEDAALGQWEAEKKNLEKAAGQAGKSKTDTVLDVNRSLTDAARKVQDSEAAQRADAALELNRLELDYKREQLERYRDILKAEGRICSGTAGVVTGVGVTAGERTPDGAAVSYAVRDENLRFRAALTKEQKKYVDMGAEVTLSLGGGRERVGGRVDYLAELPSSPGSYEALVLLEAGKGSMGQSGTMEVTARSESYAQCVPVNALHTENERAFLYVVRAQAGILGEELAAEKRFVTVVDQNEKYAALEDGTLAEGEEIILSSSRPLENGDIVRYGL